LASGTCRCPLVQSGFFGGKARERMPKAACLSATVHWSFSLLACKQRGFELRGEARLISSAQQLAKIGPSTTRNVAGANRGGVQAPLTAKYPAGISRAELDPDCHPAHNCAQRFDQPRLPQTRQTDTSKPVPATQHETSVSDHDPLLSDKAPG